MKKILVTGASGFLGSHLVEAFMREGRGVVALVRKSGGQSGQQRMENLFNWFGLNGSARRYCEIVEGDISQPGFELDYNTYRSLQARTSEIIHCAANTSFGEQRRGDVEMANLAAMKNVLQFAAGASVSCFHLVSTAFVGSPDQNACKEEIPERKEFPNVYEETKYLAEKTVRSFCESNGLPWKIYRPSVVYGKSFNGKTFRFNGLYYPIKTLYLLKKIFLKDLNNGANRSRELGVFREQTGRLFFPIELETHEDNGINLIPVDYFVKAFLFLYENNGFAKIHHITHPRSTSPDTLVSYISEYFHLAGITTRNYMLKPKNRRNAMEHLFYSYLGEYHSYLQDSRKFDASNTIPVLQASGIHCPELDYPVFKKIMDYAMETNWGKSILPC
ncbi:MAG: SDR family oxidoreductase [bacterium]